MGNNKFLGSIAEFIRKIDAKSWPAFFMFAVVLAAAGGLNYVTMAPIVGSYIAIAIACFFGIGVLSWHIVESRTDDSEEQEGMAQFAKWLNVILDGILLILNLFRAELGQVWNLNLWAFIIIGASAASHVVFFLLWTQSDPRRAIKKEGERALSGIDRQKQRATNAINFASAKLEFEKWVIDEGTRLRELYASLPTAKVNEIVKKMEDDARKQFEKKQEEGKGQQQGQQQQNPRPAPVQAARTPAMAEQGEPLPKLEKHEARLRPAEWSLDGLLKHLGKTADEARKMLDQFGLDTAEDAWKALDKQNVLPMGMKRDNFYRLFDELTSPNSRRGE
jgi:hypothetical protein